MFRLVANNRFLVAAATGGLATLVATQQAFAETASLTPKDFKGFKIAEVKDYNHNTKILKFKIPDQEQIQPASFVLVRHANLIGDDGQPIVRPYTPIRQADGELTLLVKGYPQGKLSKKIVESKVGDVLEIKGPLPKFQYVPNSKKEIGFIAGGTGITPFLQLARKILSNPDDKTKLTLLFANHEERDILLKEELDALAAKHPNFKVHYVVSKPSSGWKGLKGRINEDVIRKYLPAPADGILIGVCGPLGMYKDLSGTKTKDFQQGEVDGALKHLGYNKDQVFKF